MATKKKAEPDVIERLKAGAKERFGDSVVFERATDMKYPFDLRRPTGILSIDLGLSGGFPAGTMSILFGAEGTAKNFIMFSTAAQVQSNYGDKAKILMLSFGYGMDVQYARLCGCRIAYSKQEMEYIEEQARAFGEEIPDDVRKELTAQPGEFIILDLGKGKKAREMPAETQLEGILWSIEQQEFQLILVDEAIGALLDKDSAAKALGDDPKMAAQAVLLSQFCRKFFHVIKIRDDDGNPNETTLLMVSQTRANVEGGRYKYASKFSRSGGQAPKHTKVVEIETRAVRKIIDSKGNQLGKEIGWKITKQKVGGHEGASGTINFLFSYPGFIDHTHDIATMAREYGLITRAGRYHNIVSPSGEAIVSKIDGGFEGVVQHLRRNGELAKNLAHDVLVRSEIQCRLV